MAEKKKEPDSAKTLTAIMCLLFLLVGFSLINRCSRGNIIPPDKSEIHEPAK